MITVLKTTPVLVATLMAPARTQVNAPANIGLNAA